MKIEIEIPEEFEEHFYKDKFSGSFDRIINDIEHRLDTEDTFLAGNYEKEVVEMLKTAFRAVQLPPSCGNCVFKYGAMCCSPYKKGIPLDFYCSYWRERRKI